MTCPGSVSRPGNPDATSVLPPPWPTVRPDPEEAQKRTRAWGGEWGECSLCSSFTFKCKHPLHVVPAWHWAGPHGGIGLADGGVLRPEMAATSQRKEGTFSHCWRLTLNPSGVPALW